MAGNPVSDVTAVTRVHAQYLACECSALTVARVIRRAPRTAYYLNRAARRLALVARKVRLPAAVGNWISVADGVEPPWKVFKMLAATFPGLDAERLPFIALLSDADVDDFERELEADGLLRPDLPDTG